MQVAQYTYQSPSSSSVQVGKLDPSSVQSESNSQSSSLPNAALNETATKAQSFAATQKSEVTPSLSKNSIDLYA